MKFILMLLLTSCTNSLIQSGSNNCSEYSFSRESSIVIKDDVVVSIDKIPGRSILWVGIKIPEEVSNEVTHIYLWPLGGIDKTFCNITKKTERKFCDIRVNKQGFSVRVYMDNYIDSLNLDLIREYVNSNICEWTKGFS